MNHQKIRHLIKSFKHSIVIQINYSIILNIMKQSLITFIIFIMRMNVYLIRAS